MDIIEMIAAILAFRTVPTTVLVVVVYVAVFISVFVTDQLPPVPKNQYGLNLDQAYADLHQIAARPHAYNSHANDIVRHYILSRIRNVTSGHPHIHVSNDLISNGSWTEASQGVYFEGTNILVKIDGSEPEYVNAGGVLFSAHYDSVSTAPGATDDGMGVATLMQMVEYLTLNRPKRTAIFNINNGEEDWLNGAHAYLEHPWSKIPDTFLNLEGASSGGRPLLFRATSSAPVRSFSPKYVPHPHANILSADAFARGLVKSGTDYSVYTQDGLEGVDLAFYKGRSMYHTKYDAIPHTVGQERALWAMMEMTRGAGVALANDDKTHVRSGQGTQAIYFDLFGTTTIIFSLSSMLTFNIVALAIGPVILILLLVSEHVIQTEQRQVQNGEVPRRNDEDSLWREVWRWFTDLGWLGTLWKWSKFWVAIVVAVCLQVLLVFGYVEVNPYIVYSQPYLVILSMLALIYISVALTFRLQITQRAAPSPEQQKHTTLLQIYILTWILLLQSTIVIVKSGVGGFYFVTAWNALAFLGCALACVEGIFGAEGTQDHGEGEQQRRYVHGVRYEAVPEQGHVEEGDNSGAQPESRAGVGAGVEMETEPTENTPLIPQQRRRFSTSRSPGRRGKKEGGVIGWWILQFLIVVPVPVILLSHVGILLTGALPQTLGDGSSVVIVYGACSLIAFFLVLPIAPFSLKIHRWFTYFLFLIFVACIIYNFLVFPFSQESPLKVFFLQQLPLDFQTKSPGKAVTSLTGLPGYLDRMIIPKLPSARGKDIQCSSDTGRIGLMTCTWESGQGMMPVPGGEVRRTPTRSTEWMRVNATRLGATSARLEIQGTNTRSCRVYFDNRPVVKYVVSDPARKRNVGTMQPGYGVRKEGVKEVRLWSRTWDRKFVVDVEWKAGDDASGTEEEGGLKGRFACEWVEYESGSVGIGSGGKIPALEEVLALLPKWAVVSKRMDGLAEVWGDFLI